jgi:hypothetical protein
MPWTRCENCGEQTDARPLFSREDLLACERCGAWCVRQGAYAAAEVLYDERYFNGGEYASYAESGSTHRLNFRRKLALMRRAGMPAAADVRLLEIGAATGEFLLVAREAGVRSAMGLEVSAYARNAAAARGLDVRAPDGHDTEAAIRELRPNVIVGWDVWEHLPRPATTWDDLVASAADGALVALTTVDASSAVARARGTRWRQFHPPTHLNFPTRRSLRTYFEARGCTIQLHRAFGYFRPLREYLRGVGIRAGGSALWNIPIYLNLYDTQLVIAKRTRPER